MAGYVWLPVLSNWDTSPYPTHEMLQIGYNSINLNNRNQWVFEPDSELRYGYVKVAYAWTGKNGDYVYPQFGALNAQGSGGPGIKRLFFVTPDYTMYDMNNIILSLYSGIHGNFYISSSAPSYVQVVHDIINPDIPLYIGATYNEAFNLVAEAFDDGIWYPSTELYPITYHYTNSIVSGPSEAAVGDNVIVSAVPDVGYRITDASTQILVTNSDVAVPYTWDATNQRITFTMPQPVGNRGGFGSTGQ